MKKLALTLLAGASTLFVGSANATDIYTSSEYTNPALLAQPVRMVCDDSGRRCYRTGRSRVIVRDSHDYAPVSAISSAVATAITTTVRGAASAFGHLASVSAAIAGKPIPGAARKPVGPRSGGFDLQGDAKQGQGHMPTRPAKRRWVVSDARLKYDCRGCWKAVPSDRPFAHPACWPRGVQ